MRDLLEIIQTRRSLRHFDTRDIAAAMLDKVLETTQNQWLMAHHLGVGTVIAGRFDHDRARAVIEVPDGYEPVTPIPVGYPAKTSSAPKRRDIHAFTHQAHF